MKKKLIIPLCLISVLATGCSLIQQTETTPMPEEKDLLTFVDNITCQDLDCNLKNNYQAGEMEELTDKDNNQYRKITLTIPKYDLKFTVSANFVCKKTGSFGKCEKGEYIIESDYHQVAKKFFDDKFFNEENIRNNCLEFDSNNDCKTVGFELIQADEITNISNNLNKYLNFVNKVYSEGKIRYLDDDNGLITVSLPTCSQTNGLYIYFYIRKSESGAYNYYTKNDKGEYTKVNNVHTYLTSHIATYRCGL